MKPDLVASMLELAAAVGVPLTLSAGKVGGSASVAMDTPTQVPMKMNVRVVDSFIKDGLGVIYHISGDLYMIAFHLSTSGVVSLYLLDGKGLTDETVMPKLEDITLRNVVTYLRKRIVASHYWTGASWATLKLPK